MKQPICIDPGASDILYCGSRNTNNELIIFKKLNLFYFFQSQKIYSCLFMI